MPMPKKRIAATLGYLTLAATDTYLAGRSGKAARRARYVTKPLLMPALAASTQLASDESGGATVRGVQAAQLFSWGGDVALLGKSEKSFLTGVGSFFAAHVAYIAAFAIARDPHASVTDPGPKTAAAAWLATAPVMAIAAGRKDPTLRLPIAAYAGILSTMFATSTTLKHSLPQGARRRILAGTSLFLISDSLLGAQEFLRKDRSPALESAVMGTYTAGQWLIAEGSAAAARATDSGAASAPGGRHALR
ncbi:MAG TPA: lysoplasmalogenase [Nocardioidaceae bacterium]|nr:lysoplasmalogenase [Nocardioidaceae bacterium]